MKTIKQTNIFNTTPEELYSWFMDSKKHSQFTGSKTVIGKKVGDKISAWDGYIEGKNEKLVSGKLIVQSWRAKDWKNEVYSKVTFRFSSAGKGKTKLDFTHTGIPDENYKDIKQGWTSYYWNPLKDALK